MLSKNLPSLRSIFRFGLLHILKPLWHVLMVWPDLHTVLTFNFCTKCLGIIHHNTHTLLPPSFLGMDAWMTPRLNNELRFASYDVLGLFSDMLSMCYYNQALVDILSAGTGIKYLYCTGHSRGYREVTAL